MANKADIVQYGFFGLATINQDGWGNQASITQPGWSWFAAGIITQAGHKNRANVIQYSFSNVNINQEGSHNVVDPATVWYRNTLKVDQVGRYNRLTVDGRSYNSTMIVTQHGVGNYGFIMQRDF